MLTSTQTRNAVNVPRTLSTDDNKPTSPRVSVVSDNSALARKTNSQNAIGRDVGHG